jgi:hypothetical protein
MELVEHFGEPTDGIAEHVALKKPISTVRGREAEA